MTPAFELDLLQTLTLAAVVYFGGILLRRRVGQRTIGAFFIDFTNAIIITFFVNWLR
jgi:hypothetical protein